MSNEGLETPKNKGKTSKLWPNSLGTYFFNSKVLQALKILLGMFRSVSVLSVLNSLASILCPSPSEIYKLAPPMHALSMPNTPTAAIAAATFLPSHLQLNSLMDLTVMDLISNFKMMGSHVFDWVEFGSLTAVFLE